MNIIDRRSFLGTVCSLPILDLTKFEKEVSVQGVSIKARYWIEKRWDIFTRLYQTLEKTIPGINIEKLTELISLRMNKDGKYIEWLRIYPGFKTYYVSFYYKNSDMALAEPII